MRAALGDPTDLAALRRLTTHLGESVPDHALRGAIQGLVDDAPDLIPKLVRTTGQFQYAAAATGDGFDAIFAHLYDAAVHAGDDHRQSFVRGCVESPACMDRLEHALKNDHGALFRGMKNLNTVAEDLGYFCQSHQAQAKRLIRLILPTLSDPTQIATFAAKLRGLGPVQDEMSRAVFDRVRHLGLQKFSADQLVDLTRSLQTDRATTRELMYLAAENVANPREALLVRRGLDEANLGTAELGARLTRKFHDYAPTAGDFENARDLKVGVGRPRPSTLAPDCVNALARLLGGKR